MVINELKLYPLKQRFIILLFVVDIFAWLLAGFSSYYIQYSRESMDLVCLFSLFIAGKGMTSRKCINLSTQYFIICLSIILIPIIIYGDVPFVAVVSKLCFAIAFVALKPNYKWVIYKIFLRVFTILLLLGIIEYTLLLAGINFTWTVVERSDPYQVLNQGLFILVPTYSVEGFARFMSLCEEPGSLGTICFFLLTTLEYKSNKREFLILLVAGLLSFSLGFYVLITMWTVIRSRTFGFSQIILGVLAVLFMVTYFSGFLEERIIERVSVNNIVTIDNRTDEESNKKLKEIASDHRLYIGMGNRNYYEWQGKAGSTSAGVKNFIFQYGLLGLLLLIIGFSMLVINVRGLNKFSLTVLIFLWICFYKSNTWNLPPLLVAVLSVSPAMYMEEFKKKKI